MGAAKKIFARCLHAIAMALITAKKGTAMIAAALYGSEKQNFKRYWWPPGNAQSTVGT